MRKKPEMKEIKVNWEWRKILIISKGKKIESQALYKLWKSVKCRSSSNQRFDNSYLEHLSLSLSDIGKWQVDWQSQKSLCVLSFISIVIKVASYRARFLTAREKKEISRASQSAIDKQETNRSSWDSIARQIHWKNFFFSLLLLLVISRFNCLCLTRSQSLTQNRHKFDYLNKFKWQVLGL